MSESLPGGDCLGPRCIKESWFGDKVQREFISSVTFHGTILTTTFATKLIGNTFANGHTRPFWQYCDQWKRQYMDTHLGRLTGNGRKIRSCYCPNNYGWSFLILLLFIWISIVTSMRVLNFTWSNAFGSRPNKASVVETLRSKCLQKALRKRTSTMARLCVPGCSMEVPLWKVFR